MKSVLISIRPDWIQKIFYGDKTVEIRKTRPKIEPPFRCFVYCTSVKSMNLEEYAAIHAKTSGSVVEWSGMVVGEFVCDAIERLDMDSVGLLIDRTKEYSDWNPCMSRGELIRYTGGMKPYGWHISELQAYYWPKPLSDFGGVCSERIKDDNACSVCQAALKNYGHCPFDKLKRPPQSWQYAMLC